MVNIDFSIHKGVILSANNNNGTFNHMWIYAPDGTITAQGSWNFPTPSVSGKVLKLTNNSGGTVYYSIMFID